LCGCFSVFKVCFYIHRKFEPVTTAKKRRKMKGKEKLMYSAPPKGI